MDIEKVIIKKTGRAIGDFDLIVDGDRVMVALSGGKDSWTLLYALEALRRKAPVNFSLVAVNINPGFPGFRSDIIEERLKLEGFTYHIENSNIYGVLMEKVGPDESGYCALCARIRRGVLYRIAGALGCTKIALGHHGDDLIETLLMSAFYNGELRSMPPKLLAEDGVNVIIRPLCYVWESETHEFAEKKGLPVMGCMCPVCRGSAQKRYKVKSMIGELADENPRLRENMLGALGNLKPKYLMDKRFW